MSRSLFLDRLVEDQIDVADDRRGVGFRFEILRVDGVAAEFEGGEDILHGLGIAAVEALITPRRAGRGDHHVDFASEREAQVLDRLRIQRIDQRHMQSGLIELDRQGAMKAGGAGRHEGEQSLGRRSCGNPHLGADFVGDQR